MSPFRLNEFRAKIQFVTFASMPHLIYKAAKARGVVSNTRYIQEALCAALAKDLGVPVEQLLVQLPPCRGAATVLSDRSTVPSRGREYVVEQVR